MRERRLRPRTVEGYQHLLNKYLLPEFTDIALGDLTARRVRSWWASLDPSTPTVNARAYTLLKGICATAVEDELLATNPCRIRAASSAPRAKEIRPATVTELASIVEAMPPSRRALVLLCAWCARRRGEVLELRRQDVDLQRGVIRVERAVQWLGNRPVVGPPKSSAGRRTVAIPPHLVPVLQEHLSEQVRGRRTALLFTAADGSSYLTPTALQGSWSKARLAAGREDLRLHDLRHTGATMADNPQSCIGCNSGRDSAGCVTVAPAGIGGLWRVGSGGWVVLDAPCDLR